MRNPLEWMAGRLSARRRQLERPLRIFNRTRETELAAWVKTAVSSAQRYRGLLGRTALAPGEGLWMIPCQMVHTFFLRFPIDLVYVDRKMRVRKVVREMPPWRISVCVGAHSVLELTAGSARAAETMRGDLLTYAVADGDEAPVETD